MLRSGVGCGCIYLSMVSGAGVCVYIYVSIVSGAGGVCVYIVPVSTQVRT